MMIGECLSLWQVNYGQEGQGLVVKGLINGFRIYGRTMEGLMTKMKTPVGNY